MRGDSLPKSGFFSSYFGGRIPTPLRWLRGSFTQPSGPTCPSVRRPCQVWRESVPLLYVGEKPDFRPVSKFNTGSLPLCGNPAGNNVIVQRNYQSVGIGHCYCHYTITLSFSLVHKISSWFGFQFHDTVINWVFFHRTSHHAPSVFNVAALSLLHKLPHMAFHKALFSVLFFS